MRREEIGKRAIPVAAVAAALQVAVQAGWLNLDDAGVQQAAEAIAAVAGPLVVWAWARAHTTSAHDPRDDQGQPLVVEHPPATTFRPAPPPRPPTPGPMRRNPPPKPPGPGG